MTIEECKMVIDSENSHIEYVKSQILRDMVGHTVVDEDFTIGQWFEFNSRFNRSGVYEDSKRVQQRLRERGFDVRMNMQDYTLVLIGELEGSKQ